MGHQLCFNLTLVHVQESSYFLLLLNRTICSLKSGLVKLFNQSQNVFPSKESELQQEHSAVNRDKALRVVVWAPPEFIEDLVVQPVHPIASLLVAWAHWTHFMRVSLPSERKPQKCPPMQDTVQGDSLHKPHENLSSACGLLFLFNAFLSPSIFQVTLGKRELFKYRYQKG